MYDPHVKKFKYEILGFEDAVKDSDCIVLITDHTQFKETNPKEMAYLMRNKNAVDTRNVLDVGRWKETGFNVKVLGDGRC